VDDTETSRVARVVGLLAVAVAVTGGLLIGAGLLDLHWWGTASAQGLRHTFDTVRVQYGVLPPALLRDGSGAAELVVLGVCSLAFTGLAPLIVQGRRWARTVALTVALATFSVGLIEVGADAAQPVDLRAYLQLLSGRGTTELVAQIQALIYPAGYGWIEDVAQGLQVLASLAVVVTLSWVSVWYPDFFVGLRASAPPADDRWNSALERIRRQNAGQRPGEPDDPATDG
jgi:hypothetical protein